jgi:thiol:disulfide interchange protein DsbC
LGDSEWNDLLVVESRVYEERLRNMFRVAAVFSIGALLVALTGLAGADEQVIKAALKKAFPDATIYSVRASSIPDLFEVEVEGKVLYVSGDGKFLLSGDLFDIESRTNLSEGPRGRAVSRQIDSVGESNMIVMGPDHPLRTISVFTDVDCPYCARLHLEVPQLTKQGVKVRYLLFPRNGIGSQTYQRSVAVWCAADRVKAVGIAKSGGTLDMKTCPNPVSEHYQVGERLNVSGTPTIFTDDGQKIGGYVPAARLLAILGIAGTPGAANSR